MRNHLKHQHRLGLATRSNSGALRRSSQGARLSGDLSGKKAIFGTFPVLFCGLATGAAAAAVAASAAISTPVAAANNAKSDVSVSVVNGCSIAATGTEHNVSVSAGTYTESIGDPTVFQIACNDTNTYTINAVGYSNDTEGTTQLIGTPSNGNIETGVQQEGGTSNWNFHLLDNSAGVTIADSFDAPHEIPGSGTVIAKRDSGFKNPGNTGFDIFKVAYSAYISTLQPAGAYKGKVKYTLYNQGIAYNYTINYHLNGGQTGPSSQTNEVMDLTVKLSADKPTRDGYNFVTWCSVDPKDAETCSGDSYDPGASYTLPGNNATVDLYATWKSAKPTYGQDCNTSGKVMKDGKCWSKSDVSSSANWNTANTLCTTPWHLPSQQEFDKLLLAYYPSASVNGVGHIYYFSGDAATFTNDWGAASGNWWSSTAYNSSSAYYLYLDGSTILSYNNYSKAGNCQVRCVSED